MQHEHQRGPGRNQGFTLWFRLVYYAVIFVVLWLFVGILSLGT